MAYLGQSSRAGTSSCLEFSPRCRVDWYPPSGPTYLSRQPCLTSIFVIHHRATYQPSSRLAFTLLLSIHHAYL